MLPFLVPVLFTFYIQGVLKKFKKFRCQKVKHGTFVLHWKPDEFDVYSLYDSCEFRIVDRNGHNDHSASNGQQGGISNRWQHAAPTPIVLSCLCPL
jgi:hypothetical protein